MKKRVLIFGASGLLGTSLVQYLLSTNEWDLVTHGKSKGVSDCIGDLTDPLKVAEFVEQYNPDFVINLVALTNVDLCEKEPQSAYLVNAKIVQNIVSCIRNKKSFLVQLSTDHIYDTAGENEEENIVLRNYYAYSKYLADVFAEQANSVILRTNFMGKSRVQDRTSFSDWIFNSIEANQEVTLFNDVYFSPLSMHTLCKMIEHVLKKPVKGVYNLGCRAGMSKAAFAIKFSKKLNRGTLKYKIDSVVNKNFSAKRPQFMQMDVTKFEIAYDVQLPTLEEEIMRLTKEYQ